MYSTSKYIISLFEVTLNRTAFLASVLASEMCCRQTPHDKSVHVESRTENEMTSFAVVRITQEIVA